MSDTDNKAGDEPNSELVDATFSAADMNPGDEADTDEAPATGRNGARRGPGVATSIAWLALFLALIGVAGVGYLALQEWRDASAEDDSVAAIAALERRLSERGEALETVSAGVSRVESAASAAESGVGRNAAALDRLQQDLDRRGQLLDSLPPRMSSIEQTVAALQGVSIDARNTYLIAEAEYYMQIANAQLQLAGNPYLATLALGQADDRLLQLADPALTDVRRALADEMAALEVMEKPDVAGATLTLASLANVVESLPLRSTEPATQAPAEGTEPAAEESGIGRAWGSVKGAFSGLVKVTPPTDDKAPLLTPDAEPLIRSNLSLQLQAARLALLRGEAQIFEQSLDDADAWITAYFDVTSPQVTGARQTIDEIRAGYSAVTPPDISGSLRLLRQYKTLQEPQQ